MIGIAATLAGCSLEPRATQDERGRLTQAGTSYESPFEKRVLPELPDQPNWTDVLHRAFLANGELEAAYFEWKAALARVAPAAAWPNSNVELGFDYAFGKDAMKGWNATTLTAGFDPAMTLSLPIKARQAGKVALDSARAASKRFEAAKFGLQQTVLTTWLDYALTAERVRIQTENVSLFKTVTETAARRVQTGGPQQDLLKAQTEYEMARNELGNLTSELAGQRATLNGLLSRKPDEALAPPDALPLPRPLIDDDARLIAMAVRNNPQLAAMAHEVAGRDNALQLAHLAYLPDFAPQIGIEGNAQQSVGMMVHLPTTLVQIRGAIDEAQANLRQSQALLRQTQAQRAAQFVATLVALRNNERQAILLQDVIAPRARQLRDASSQAYSAGSANFADLIDAQRTLLQVRLLTAEARIAREKRLAELETLAGVDVETLEAPPQVSPTSGPADQSSTGLRVDVASKPLLLAASAQASGCQLAAGSVGSMSSAAGGQSHAHASVGMAPAAIVQTSVSNGCPGDRSDRSIQP